MSKWIWMFGELERYHHLRVHDRREKYGYAEPVDWKMYANEPVVVFRKTVETEGGPVHLSVKGSAMISVYDRNTQEMKIFPEGDFMLPPGKQTVYVKVSSPEAFPCLYAEGAVSSDESWFCDDMTGHFKPVGTSPLFEEEKKSPTRFPFQYEEIPYLKKLDAANGVVYDFGKEVYAAFHVFQIRSEEPIEVRFGESLEEAMDPLWAVHRYVRENHSMGCSFRNQAFRYVFVSDKEAEVQAVSEYLTREEHGTFESGDELISRIYETACHTYDLTAREFYLDGLKRDGFVWSTEAFQSILASHYLDRNQETEKRTLIALSGKLPVRQYVNNVMEGSLYWFIALYEYYRYYLDIETMIALSGQMIDVMRFLRSRVGEDGLIRALPGERVFRSPDDSIDRNETADRFEAGLGEQVLLYAAVKGYAQILSDVRSELIHKVSADQKKAASEKPAIMILEKELRESCRLQEKLYRSIMPLFWDDRNTAFRDTVGASDVHFSRQNNLLACTFFDVPQRVKELVYEHVIKNPEIPAVTSPLFKLYENRLRYEMGDEIAAEEDIKAYYGGMLQMGATSFFESFDPEKQDVSQYAFNGHPYEKSLCHASGANVIYLLGTCQLGVSGTAPGFRTFEVRPKLGSADHIHGIVPVPGGSIEVWADREKASVRSSIPGGVLYYGIRSTKIPANKKMTVWWEEDPLQKKRDN